MIDDLSDIIIPILISVIFIVLISKAIRQFIKQRQLRFIEHYRFHPALAHKVMEKYPHLTSENTDLVFTALRDYFFFCNRAGRRMISMPSQVVDVAWHAFILFTRDYDEFCRHSFGRFLHHTPTEAMRTKTLAQDGIKRAWRLACLKENIDPNVPSKLPLLFAIDGLLNIPDGFKYSLNCSDRSSPNYGDGYCASHIGCASGCGGGTASCGSDGCASGCGGDGGGCGGGCGGD